METEVLGESSLIFVDKMQLNAHDHQTKSDHTLIGPFLRTPTPKSDNPPMLSSNDILVAGSTRDAAAAETADGISAAAMATRVTRDKRGMVGMCGW